MEIAYCDWGGIVETSCDQLNIAVQKVYKACLDNSSCEVVELKSDAERRSQSIIADFADGSFDIDNSIGIHRVERLALTYCADKDFCWEVRALRKDFPPTIHQNHVLQGEPRSLCLYMEPWETVERSWTPELFIKRAFWWLKETAEGTIHGNDQPIEQLFFSCPVNVILPANHFDSEVNKNKKISFVSIDNEEVNTKTLIGKYNNDDRKVDAPFCLSVSVLLDAVENGRIEDYPHTLGQLQDILLQRGSDIVSPLKESLDDLMTADGIESQGGNKEFVLLLLGIPRTRRGVIEKVDIQGFIIELGIGKLGECLSLFFKDVGQGRWYRWNKLGCDSAQDSESWKSLSLFPVNAKCYPSSEDVRKYSGLESGGFNPVGIIAGVGALGGLLAKIWKREGWGEWSYVDDDIVQAHNIVRHISSHHCIGYQKATVVDSIVNDIHLQNEEQVSSHFVTSIVSDEPALKSVIAMANILIDVTTTLHVPRVISRKDSFPRTASVFITPSGMSSVMLLEDENRNIRCGSLEAQYYRAILKSVWGANHLSGHIGRQWVGAGCREVTLAMSDELVHLHAATLSRQIRKASCQPEARIRIWDYQDDLGGITPYEITVFPSQSVQLKNWEVIWDEGFLDEAKEFRFKVLPNETGGILFGIIDQKDKTITLVKAYAAPENSQSTLSSFARGAYDSTDIIDGCYERTAGIVGYVGEWHSHPQGYNALPSKYDIAQLSFLTSSLQIEGMPALMMIVADSSVGFYLDNQGITLELK